MWHNEKDQHAVPFPEHSGLGRKSQVTANQLNLNPGNLTLKPKRVAAKSEGRVEGAASWGFSRDNPKGWMLAADPDKAPVKKRGARTIDYKVASVDGWPEWGQGGIATACTAACRAPLPPPTTHHPPPTTHHPPPTTCHPHYLPPANAHSLLTDSRPHLTLAREDGRGDNETLSCCQMAQHEGIRLGPEVAVPTLVPRYAVVTNVTAVPGSQVCGIQSWYGTVEVQLVCVWGGGVERGP